MPASDPPPTGSHAAVQVDGKGTDAVAVVRLGREVDILGASGLERTLRDAIGRQLPVLIDLTGCRFLDAAGLRAIIALRAARDDGAVMAVCAPGSLPDRLLERAAGPVLERAPTREAGLARLRAGR